MWWSDLLPKQKGMRILYYHREGRIESRCRYFM